MAHLLRRTLRYLGGFAALMILPNVISANMWPASSGSAAGTANVTSLDGAYAAASRTASAITGDIVVAAGRITFANGASMALRLARADLVGVFAIDPPANPVLLGGNKLCGEDPPRYIVLAQSNPNSLYLKVFDGPEVPAFSNNVLPQPGMCASYNFERVAAPALAGTPGPAAQPRRQGLSDQEISARARNIHTSASQPLYLGEMLNELGYDGGGDFPQLQQALNAFRRSVGLPEGSFFADVATIETLIRAREAHRATAAAPLPSAQPRQAVQTPSTTVNEKAGGSLASSSSGYQGESVHQAMLGAASVERPGPSPEEMVRGIYGTLGLAPAEERQLMARMQAPDQRARYFTPVLVGLFDANDSYGSDLGFSCIDFSLVLDGQDYDEGEIDRTLQIDSRVTDDQATVDARFTVFGAPNHYEYKFKKTPDGWKIADIASVGGWRLSEIDCKPASGEALRSAGVTQFVQERLGALGYGAGAVDGTLNAATPGAVDGTLNAATLAALGRYAADRGLAFQGALTSELVAALADSSAQASAVSTSPGKADADTEPMSSFEEASEPTHDALLSLYMAANADILEENDAMAWHHYLVRHIPPDRARRPLLPSAECRALTTAVLNQFEREERIKQARALFRKGLERARGAATTRLFKLRQTLNLDDYDHDQEAFAFPEQFGPGVLGGVLLIRRSSNDLGNTFYSGPVTDYCTTPPDPKRLGGLPGIELMPEAGKRRGRFGLSVTAEDQIRQLPMTPAAAKAYLASFSGKRGQVVLETLVEVGPATLDPANPPGQMPARIIAARAVHPTTGAVLFTYALTPTTETAERQTVVSGTNDHAPLTNYRLAYLMLRHQPRLLAEDRLIDLARRQIAQEQYCYAALAETTPFDQQRHRLNPNLPLITLSWQSLRTEPTNQADNALLDIFVTPEANWSIATDTAGYDTRFNHFVEAFLFDPGAIRDRNADFLARELAPTFKEFVETAVRQHAPERLRVVYPLAAVAYDPQAGALRFKGPQSGSFLERSDLLPKTQLKLDEETAKFAYDPNAHGYIAQSENTMNPGVRYSCKGSGSSSAGPPQYWRGLLADLTKNTSWQIAVPALVFDHDLSLASIELSAQEAEQLSAKLNHMGEGLLSRIFFHIERVDMAESGTRPVALFRAMVESVEILTKDGEVIARLEPQDFPTAETLGVKAAERLEAGPRYELVGLSIGMSFDEADTLIRKHMEVETVLEVVARADLPPEKWFPFNSGRVYRAKNDEQIAIFDEPPAGSQKVVAVLRELPLPRGSFKEEDIDRQLRERYGEFQSEGRIRYWGSETAYGCVLEIAASFPLKARPIEGPDYKVPWRPRVFSRHQTYHLWNEIPDECGQVTLSAEFDQRLKPDRLLYAIHDHRLHKELYNRSVEMTTEALRARQLEQQTEIEIDF